MPLEAAYKAKKGPDDPGTFAAYMDTRPPDELRSWMFSERGGHLGVTKHGWPFAEGQVGGDDGRGAFVEPADQVEQQLTASLREGQIAEFIEDCEVEPGEVVGDAAISRLRAYCLITPSLPDGHSSRLT